MPDDKEDDVWTRRLNVVLKIATILSPVLLAATLWLQSQTNTKIDDAKTEVKQVATEAVQHAKTAAKVATAAKEELDDSRKERKEQFEVITQKQDADLKNWHAYDTKQPEDMNRAREALSKEIGSIQNP